jgi:catechol 2,3-dioxygenase-like lactoylglutathione lyase family enzyme
MSIELNHTIIWSKDKRASAAFLAGILGLEVGSDWGPFIPIRTGNGVTLDFAESENVRPQHYAFLVSDAEFDAGLARVKQAKIAFFADHDRSGPGEINHHYNGRGFYFADPNGHFMELITKPYGASPES